MHMMYLSDSCMPHHLNVQILSITGCTLHRPGMQYAHVLNASAGLFSLHIAREREVLAYLVLGRLPTSCPMFLGLM